MTSGNARIMRPLAAAARPLHTLAHVHRLPQSSACAYLTLRAQQHLQTNSRRPTISKYTACGATSSPQKSSRKISNEQRAKDLNQQGVDEALSNFDSAVADEREKQVRTPWHREGVDKPPVRRQRSAGAMTKGKCHCAARRRTSC